MAKSKIFFSEKSKNFIYSKMSENNSSKKKLWEKLVSRYFIANFLEKLKNYGKKFQKKWEILENKILENKILKIMENFTQAIPIQKGTHEIFF